MLIGIWKNVEELEACIGLDELQAILEASRQQRHEERKFMAALKGIDLDKESGRDSRARFEQAKIRAAARLQGRSTDEVEFSALGIDVEVE